MHEVVFTKRAITDWEKLDERTRARIAKKLKEYSINPFQYARKLSHSKIGTYRFRIGDFRVVFDVEKQSIVVLRIGDRKEIYR